MWATFAVSEHQRSQMLWLWSARFPQRVFLLFFPALVPVNIQRGTCGNSSHMMRGIIVFEESHIPRSAMGKREGGRERCHQRYRIERWSEKSPRRSVVSLNLAFLFSCFRTNSELYLDRGGTGCRWGVAVTSKSEMDGTAACLNVLLLVWPVFRWSMIFRATLHLSNLTPGCVCLAKLLARVSTSFNLLLRILTRQRASLTASRQQ